ncbi:MAG: ABC-type transport auxiliary lipoprotein family protein [Thiotrichaceae bacterium]|nr:ABC-type transport auxiliary lipoprotein family protein [Thiotrichaceae bacterium]
MRVLKTFFIISSLGLSACSLVPSEDTPMAQYVFDLPSFPTSNPHSSTKIVQVAMPQAVAGFDSQGMTYIRHPMQLERYTKSQWVDTPAHMLLPLLVRSLEASGQYQAVLSASTSNLSGEIRVDTEILRLQQEFIPPQASRVHLVLRVQVFHLVERNILATQVFDLNEISSSEDAQGYVAATNQAIIKWLPAFQAFVKKAIYG